MFRAVNSPVAFKSSLTSAVVRSFGVVACSILVTRVCNGAFVNVRTVFSVAYKSKLTGAVVRSFGVCTNGIQVTFVSGRTLINVVFTVLSLESFGTETLVVVFFVQWETFTFVLAWPSTTGCRDAEVVKSIAMHKFIRVVVFV